MVPLRRSERTEEEAVAHGVGADCRMTREPVLRQVREPGVRWWRSNFGHPVTVADGTCIIKVFANALAGSIYLTIERKRASLAASVRPHEQPTK